MIRRTPLRREVVAGSDITRTPPSFKTFAISARPFSGSGR